MRDVGSSRLFLLLSLGAIFLTGCPQPKPEPVKRPTPPAAQAFSEERLNNSVPRPKIDITDFNDTVSPDKKRVLLTGTVTNRGVTTTLELKVKISALDAGDHVIDIVQAVPTVDQITPNGSARFSASMANHPDVVRYRVEALAR